MKKKKMPIIMFIALFLLVIITLLLSIFGVVSYLNEKNIEKKI